ncbi:MAG: bifunctional metallophosphatase/5'-nucleotidase [Synergistaceae bacterium]|jgi:2',3'-cyclic-nucleotide 2'-phosphodiesterase/3'-nucleotidase|nr:bifunctional metallophosphatase/5'-nucleotidase [Synergistaceae bacterium]
MGKKLLKIFYTSDTHGFLFPTNYLDSTERQMGVLNCIYNFRKKDGNTLIIDGGDTLQGSPLAKFYAEQSVADSPNPMAEAFNAGKVDYVVPGNHDFNYGYDMLFNYFDSLKAKYLCANIRDKTGKIEFIPNEICTLENGIKIGLVGITTDYIPYWEKEENLRNFVINDPFVAAKEELKAIRDKCDVTICVYHGGFENNLETGDIIETHGENAGYRICKELSFDILLTSHQHREVSGRTLFGTYTMQLPAHARKYAEVTVELSESRPATISSEIRAPGTRYDAAIYDALRPVEDEVQKWLDTQVGELSSPMIVADNHIDAALHGDPVTDFFMQVMLEFSKADICCENLKSTLVSFNESVTIREVLAAYPFPCSIVVIEVDEATLKTALERGAEFFDLKDGVPTISERVLGKKDFGYDFVAGLEYSFDISRPTGSRVLSLFYKGEPIGDKKLTMAMSDYRASGAGGYDCYKKCRVIKRHSEDIFTLAIQYLQTQKPVVQTVKTNVSVTWQ